jgi:hypothetical protein
MGWARVGTLEVTARATKATQHVKPDALLDAVRNALDRHTSSA